MEDGHPIGVIGGTGFETALRLDEARKVETPFGDAPTVHMGRIAERPAVFLPRHGAGHSLPPHRVNYRANIWALHRVGVRRLIATNAVGALNPAVKPGNLVVPDDLLDFTKSRANTFYEGKPVLHVDFTEPYCRDIRAALIRAAEESGGNIWPRGTYVCTEGPRYETPAEIRVYRSLGGDVVGMTGCPEAALARELGICYASICIVSNMAAGLQDRVTTREVVRVMQEKSALLREVVTRAVALIPVKKSCSCQASLREAGLEEETALF
ncbi:MAG: S-methyl-5'-thioadenosine phosphorylase [Candidatus Bathyarchaeia archaeon]